MSECPDCTQAGQVEHWGSTGGCMGCCARALARIFLRKGERGQRYKRALAQFDLTDQEVRNAHAADVYCKGAAS